MKRLGAAAGGLLGLGLAARLRAFERDRRFVDGVSDDPVDRVSAPGVVDHLTVLPLVEAEAADPVLAREHGLSYLLRAGSTEILFDVGLGGALAKNVSLLNIDLSRVELLVFSHPHPDHVGGIAAARHRTPALPRDVAGTAVVPVPMTTPGRDSIHALRPSIIAPGVLTTGALPRALLFLGLTWEQALVVLVREVGAVVIIGCGHPGIERILERVEDMVDTPIVGIVGGLHLPVHGLRAQAILGTSGYRLLRERDVEAVINTIERRSPRLVAVSPHDTSPWALARFAEAFEDRFRLIRAGDSFSIGGEDGFVE